MMRIVEAYNPTMAVNRQAQAGFVKYFPIIVIIGLGMILLFLLQDRTVHVDIYSWLETAKSIYLTGDTGRQMRNILFSYIMAIPMLLKLDPILFGLFLSGISLLLSTFILYKINLKHSSLFAAAYTSLIFMISYPLLRYASRVYTDIPVILCLLLMIFFQFKFYKDNKFLSLCLIYLMFSLAVSLRYASAFTFPAFLYFIWTTRKFYKWHLLGLAIAALPYIPQLIYNITYLGSPIASSYAAVHSYPIFSLEYFVKERNSDYNFQILTYLRFLLLDFRGLFILLTPISIFGAISAFKRIDRRLALYLVLFFGSYIFCLSFYFWFSNRYAIPALIPCFIWLAIGLAELYHLLRNHPKLSLLYSIGLILIAYGMAELSFQLIQSSRALHESQQKIFTDLNRFIKDGDIVISRYPGIDRYLSKNVTTVQTRVVTPEMLEPYQNIPEDIYVVAPKVKFTSEGVDYNLSVDQIQEELVTIHQVKSKKIIELGLYRTLRLLHLEYLIPFEEWMIYKIEKAPVVASDNGQEIKPDQSVVSAGEPAAATGPVAGSKLSQEPERAEGSGIRRETRALWSHAGSGAKSIQDIDKLVAQVDKAKLNTILLLIYRSGTAYFEPSHTRFPDSKERLPNKSALSTDEYSDALSYLLAIRDQRRADDDPTNDFEVHAWFTVTQNGRWKSNEDRPRADETRPYMLHYLFPEFKLKYKEYYLKNDERYINHRYSDVHQPKFRAYMTDLIAGLVEDYDVDGVHLDYIRAMQICYNNEALDYPGTAYDYVGCQEDYKAWTKATYGQEYSLLEDTQRHVTQDKGSSRIAAWQEQAVGTLVKSIHDEVKSINPKVIISAAVGMTSPESQKESVQGQVAWEWLDQGWIDAAFVMAYTPDTQHVIDKMQSIIAATEAESSRSRVFAGLATYNIDDGDEQWSYVVAEQVNATLRGEWSGRPLESPAKGVALFVDRQLSEAAIELLAKGPFKEPALPFWGK